jgi:acyl carrier protein
VSLQNELIAEIETWGLALRSRVSHDTLLIDSGVFDSMALFHLLHWIEDRVGTPIDPTAFDLTTEWQTVDRVAQFVERHRIGVPGR